MIAEKISPVYRERLASMPYGQYSRAIVTLKELAPRRSFRGIPLEQRRHILAEVQHQAEETLSQIDLVLSRFGGRRISESATSIGTVVVEGTKDAILALTTLEKVDAILEDQTITSLDLQ